MIGLALLAIGAVLLWGALTKRGDAIIAALKLDLPAAIDTSGVGNINVGGSSGGGTSGSGSSSGSTDSGSHMGIDANGNVITIGKSYGDMTPAEQDAANLYAHQIGNLGSG